MTKGKTQDVTVNKEEDKRENIMKTSLTADTIWSSSRRKHTHQVLVADVAGVAIMFATIRSVDNVTGSSTPTALAMFSVTLL